MSAEQMFKTLNRRAPTSHEEKHHGNIRRALRLMKVKMRRVDRHRANDEVRKQLT